MKMTRACPTPDECTVVLTLRAEIAELRADRDQYDSWAREIKVNIDAVRRENDELRAALKPFAISADVQERLGTTDHSSMLAVSFGMCLRARAALEQRIGDPAPLARLICNGERDPGMIRD